MIFRSSRSVVEQENDVVSKQNLYRLLERSGDIPVKWKANVHLSRSETLGCMRYALYNRDWTVGFSLGVIRFIVAEGKRIFLATAERAKSGVCHTVWGKDALAYKCRTCERDPTCAICIDCFRKGDHKGHDFAIIRTGGGCCDCGDGQAWLPSGFCSDHQGAESEHEDITSELSTNLKNRMVDAVKLLAMEVAYMGTQFKTHSLQESMLQESMSQIDASEISAFESLVSALNEFSKAGDPVKRLVGCELATVNIPWGAEGDISWFEYMLSIGGEGSMPAKAHQALHDLYYHLITDLVFKRRFLQLFIKYYGTFVEATLSQRAKNFVKRRSRSSPRLDILETFSVQLFTVPALTDLMTTKGGLLDTLIYKLLELLELVSNKLETVVYSENVDERSGREPINGGVVNPITVPPNWENEDVQIVTVNNEGIVRDEGNLFVDIFDEDDDDVNLAEPIGRLPVIDIIDDRHNPRPSHDSSVINILQYLAKKERRQVNHDAALRCATGEGRIAHYLKIDLDDTSDVVFPICWRLIFDLRYVLKHKNVAAYLVHERLDLFRVYLRMVSLLQGMYAVKQERRMRLARDSRKGRKAFLLEHECVASIISLIIPGFGNDTGSKSEALKVATKHAKLSMIKAVRQSIEERLIQERAAGTFEQYPWEGEESADFPVIKEAVSIHSPLHRILALLAQHAIRFDDVSVKLALGEGPGSNSLVLIKHPLHALAFMAQVRAGLWRRNGRNVESQCILYSSLEYPEWFIDLDIFLLQLSYVLVQHDRFIDSFVRAFLVQGVLERLRKVDEPLVMQEYERCLLHDFISTLIQISAERSLSKFCEKESYARKLSQLLCTADQTHSQLTKACRRYTDCTDADFFNDINEILSHIASFTEPKGLSEGFYKPTQTAWEAYDPFSLCFTMSQKVRAQERYRKFRCSLQKKPLLISETMASRMNIHRSMEILRNLPVLLCKNDGYVDVILRRSVQSSSGLERITAASLQLCSIGLNARTLKDQSNIVEYLMDTASGASGSRNNKFLEIEAKSSVQVVLRHALLQAELANAEGQTVAFSGRLKRALDGQPLKKPREEEQNEKSRIRKWRKMQQDKTLQKMKEAQRQFAATLGLDEELPDAPSSNLGKDQTCSLCHEGEEGQGPASYIGLARKTFVARAVTKRALLEETAPQRLERVVLAGQRTGTQQPDRWLSGNDCSGKDRKNEEQSQAEHNDHIPAELQPGGCYDGLIDWKLIVGGVDTSDAPFVSFCGHMMHESCLDRYFGSLYLNCVPRGEIRVGHRVLNLEHGEFSCPMCRGVANVLVPFRHVDDVQCEDEGCFKKGNTDTVSERNAIKSSINNISARLSQQCTSLEPASSSSDLRNRPGGSQDSGFLDDKSDDHHGMPSHSDIVFGNFELTRYSRVSHRVRLQSSNAENGIAQVRSLHSAMAPKVDTETSRDGSVTAENRQLASTRQRMSALLASIVATEVKWRSFAASQRDLRILFCDVRYSLSPPESQWGSFTRKKIVTFGALTLWNLLILPDTRVDPFSTVCILMCTWPGMLRPMDFEQVVRVGYLAIKPPHVPTPPERALNVAKSLLCMRLLYLRRMILLANCVFRREILLSVYSDNGEVQGLEDSFKEHDALVKELNIGEDLLYDRSVLREKESKNWTYSLTEAARRGESRFFFGRSSPFLPKRSGLVKLPTEFKDLLEGSAEAYCSWCHGIPREKAALCLCCGAIVCYDLNDTFNSCAGTKGHLAVCSKNFGVFLHLGLTNILLVKSGRRLLWPSPYLDDHGEEDMELKRGKPLFLNCERYAMVERLWLSHEL